jgi:hypothetical protein
MVISWMVLFWKNSWNPLSPDPTDVSGALAH